MALFHHQTIRTHLPRAKPGTQSVSQRPVGRFLLALRLAESIRPELAPALPVGRFYSTIIEQNLSVSSLPAAARRKNPPLLAKRGISIKIVRIPYAERMLATGREVLLALRLVKTISHEFASGGSPLSTCRPGLRQRRLHQRRDRACQRPGSRWSARRRPRRRR